MKNIGFAFITGNEMTDWRLVTADGEYAIEWRNNRLWAVLTTKPTVGQIIERPATEAERKEYLRIRKAQRVVINTEKAGKAKAEAKAAEKQAKIEAKAAEKAANRNAEAERAELRKIRNELKKLEAEKTEAVKAEIETKPETETEAAVKVIVNRISDLKSFIDMVSDLIDNLKAEKDSLRGTAKFYDELSREIVWNQMDVWFEDDISNAVADLMAKAENIRQRQADIPNEIIELKTKKSEAIAELKALKTVLKTMALDATIAPFVVALADKIRVRKPKDPDAEIRIAAKIPEKAKVNNYAVRVVKDRVFYKDLKKESNEMHFEPKYNKEMQTYYGSCEEALTKDSKMLLDMARDARRMAEKKVAELATTSFEVKLADTTVCHLPESMMSMIYGIDTTKLAIEPNVMIVDHGTEKFFQTNWMVWAEPGESEKQAEERQEKFNKAVYDRLDQRGLAAASRLFMPNSAGSGQLKNEKIVLVEANLRKSREDVLFFERTEKQFSEKVPVVGPELWKAWANISRPWSCDLVYADGTVAQPKDILVVKMPKYIYHHDKAIRIGDLYDGKHYKIGPWDNPVDLFAGQILFWKPLAGMGGQLNGYGIKGFGFYAGGSVMRKFLEKNHLTMEEFLDCKIENFDGRTVRIGDYSGIATDDIWKFDKFFDTYEDYLNTIDRLSKKYPIIGKLGILRQSEDEEGQIKRRHMTRSLLQQVFSWTYEEMSKLVTPTAAKIKALMAYENAIVRLAGLKKDASERTALEALFGVAPWLFMAPGVQDYWKNKLRAMVKEMMANKLDARGQYPYVIQDPIAMLEILVLGVKHEDAGIVPNGFVSLADVPEGAKVLALRFPANFLTARVRVNMALSDVFADLGNVCVLSIHDDIFVVQDGDTDGDEICILYTKLIIELIERMISEIDPPVVVFEHGTKAPRTVCGSVEELRRRLSNARYMASHNDHTGIYADMARDCAWLAAVAKENGDTAKFDMWLIYMAAASTGAIISIDQVKGNDISPVLEAWLKDIGKQIKKAMGYKKPYTQQFLKKDVATADCNRPNTASLPDAIAVEGKARVGAYCVTTPFKTWGEIKQHVIDACFVKNVPVCKVQKHVLNEVVMDVLQRTLYNDMFVKDMNGNEHLLDEEVRQKMKNGEEVELKELIVYLYHNSQALMNACEGALLAQKKQEFYALCWKVLREFAITDNKASKTVADKTANVKVNSLYTSLVNEALELMKGNGMDDPTGAYRMFCLNVVAAPLTATIRKNGWSKAAFASGAKEELNERKEVELWGEDELEFEDFQSVFDLTDAEMSADYDWLSDEKVAA